MGSIRLIVVDDHPLFRQGVADTLSMVPGFEIVAQASEGDQALNIIRTLKPDVAILDVNLPGMNGQQLTNAINSEKLPTRVIMLTGYDDEDQILHAALAGAMGYCAKDIQPDLLVRVVRAVASGKFAIGGHVMERGEFEEWLYARLDAARRSYAEPGATFHPLSDREMEVLACVVKGLSNKEIAGLLGISHQTVKNHITSILRKLAVEDRTQAVVYALKHGWVKLDFEKRLTGE
ncbi:MAG: response regulator transcription factor [Anaerolineales bacterium]